jgi:short-subunit dehydrogenase
MTYRAALITGASSGIGEAFAECLPETTDLLLTGREAARLMTLAGRLARPGRRVDIVTADLSTQAGISEVIARADSFGIDLLINNAGLGQYGHFVRNDPVQEAEMVMVNVMVPVVLTRALLPGMLDRARSGDRRAGLIVVSSVVGFAGFPFLTTYAATKAFDLRFAEGLTAELAREPVDVLALCPGSTRTRFFERSRFGMAAIKPRGHSAEQVARAGLASLGRRPVHVVGVANRAFTLLLTVLPGRFTRYLLSLAMRPRSNG